MLSKNPRQPRISVRKMYGDRLSLIHVESMNNLNGDVKVNRGASLSSHRTCGDESRMTFARKEFSSPKSSPRYVTAPCESLRDRYACTGNGDDYTQSVELTSGNELHNEATGSPKVLHRRNYLWTGHGLWVFLFLSLFFVCAKCQGDSKDCAFGLKTPGRTWPQGDIVLEYNQSLRIYCMLNETLTEPKFQGKNASDLVFFRHDREMEPEYITIVNSTTIVLYVEKLVPSEDMYYCRLRLNDSPKYEAVCLNKVVVGFKPQEPKSFNCVSQNWENLNCTWEPTPNYVTTHFSLRFKLPGRAGGRFSFPCPAPNPKYNPPPNTCLWDSSTDPIYRQVYEYYTFILNAENVLGNNSFTYRFHHWAHVIPSKPANLHVVNKTYSSAMLNWSVPFSMQNFPPGLYHRISYQSQYDHSKTWESRDLTDEKRVRNIFFNLTDLKYANAVYDVRVFTKSAEAIGEDMWSKFSDITFKTAATLPGLPPKTDIGSFEIAGNSDNRDVYIYWQTIPAHLENGDNFTYQVVRVEENGKKLNIQPSEKTKTYAKFKGISFESFEFEIVTANCQGANKDKARIRIPRRIDKPPEPAAFTKIAFEEEGLFELSWIPKNDSNIIDYTIFWCENDRDRPYQCTGYLDWIHVPRNVSLYNHTVPDPLKTYQFAIAANTANASSGMVWASCTAIHNKFVGKMKMVWINRITSDKIEVGWKLECSDRIDIIEGFSIYYCPIVSPYNLTCKDPMKSTTVKGNPHTIHGDLGGLKPYTTYMLTVAVLTKNGEGHHSDPLYNTTLEAAPSPPRDIVITNVTNTTMDVEWEPPAAMNGVLRYYTVYYNENSTNAEKETRLRIRGLKPYETYNVSVSAETVRKSNRSQPIFQTTQIGVPGKIDVPSVHFINSSQVYIQWNPPKNPGGKLDYYEIITADEYIHTNITKSEKHLAIPDCKNVGREKLYHFRVRAVNIGNNMERLEGPWSDPGEGNCYSSGPSREVWVLIWIIGCLSGVAFLLFLGYSSKRIWIKCKAMQDVEVKLPPGLQPNMKLLGKGNEQHAQQTSADSSGCSSGQESVTSSLTSDSHVSTDSGADLDPVPMSPTKLPESCPTWESSSLRQRIVTGATKPDSTDDRRRREPYVKVAKTADMLVGDSLSLARSTPNLTADGTAATTAPGLYPASQQHGWSSTDYISMPSHEEASFNDSSPPPRGKGSALGVYSVVGLAPSPTVRVRAGGEARGPERNHPRKTDLIPIGAGERKKPMAVNPYVSLASLEQKTRNVSNPQIPSFGDLADMEFVHQVRESLQPPPYSISDKLSKPYVQTGLMDATKLSRPLKKEQEALSPQRIRCAAAATAAESSGGRPPFAPNFVDSPVPISRSLVELPSNTYVPVDTARGVPSPRIAIDHSAQVQNPYVAVSTLIPSSDVSSFGSRRSGGRAEEADDHSASSYPFSSQITETSNPMTQKSLDHDDAVTRTSTSGVTSLPVVKQTSGYVTIAENPSRSTDNSISENSYVPHQQVNKKSPPPGYQPNTGQADEQYSKVTVVPTTT